MRNDESDSPNSGWLRTLTRWLSDGRHARQTLVGLAVVMALVLLASYHEVLQDQVARAERAEKVAGSGAVKPALPSMNTPAARSSTEPAQAR
jgi:hypothetical protein